MIKDRREASEIEPRDYRDGDDSGKLGRGQILKLPVGRRTLKVSVKCPEEPWFSAVREVVVSSVKLVTHSDFCSFQVD